MNLIISLYFFTITIVYKINLSKALECYVCEKQENNLEKCVKTIATCQVEEDVCLTEVSWGSTPYWTLGAKKQYYVSKMCSRNDRCHRQRNAGMTYCTHIWYEDWRCIDCCKGDRCNYYIFSNTGRSEISNVVLGLSILYVFLRLF